MIGWGRRAGAALKIACEVVASKIARDVKLSKIARDVKVGRTALLCAALALTPLGLSAVATAQQVKASSSRDASQYGPFGPEGSRLREQLWIIPSADHDFPLRATVFRPEETTLGEGEQQPRRPLVVINHGTSDATRMAVAMPV